ncbi:hypothetical protein CROQUDRAFT_61546 [Cronartium quercuum f. sp. fusiforme G11]|uniref:DNA mismatch repair proteins mutS family domain-containing protein n=1 Tax=Cronartium quercuum f. sp. fusiforme G11 TaxID=708437 RepID=A0A9P6NNU8_9BASI|nr:hypothetical protein CROQUDRAFT_61546 [Cronartium quercuum f. sp. fusiforme G11]
MFGSRLRLAARVRNEVIASSSNDTCLISSRVVYGPKLARTWERVWNSPEKLDIQAKRLTKKRVKPRSKKVIKELIPSTVLNSSQLDFAQEEVTKEKKVTRPKTKIDLTLFDQFVTIGVPPSRNPALYSRKVAKFVLDSRLRFPGAILLTCVGSFYETYFDQAIELSQLLNIKQAKYRFSGHDYPFSGFPIASLPRHLKALVQDHQRTVVIAEQIPIAPDRFERKLVKVITPGTLLDEDLIEPDSHNFLLAIADDDLAWIDVSTGTYLHTPFRGNQEELMDYIMRIAPKEIVISDQSSFKLPTEGRGSKLSILVSKVKLEPGLNNVDACGLIAAYISQNLLPSVSSSKPTLIQFSRYLQLDAEALDGLEILVSQNGKSQAGSLLSTISKTITKPGKRLMRDRLTMPSCVVSEIETRLDLVEELVNDRFLLQDLQDELSGLGEIDYERLLQRINLGQASIGDLSSLLIVLEKIASVSLRLGSSLLGHGLVCPPRLAKNISSVLDIPKQVDEPQEADFEEMADEEEEAKDAFSMPKWNVRPQYSKRLHSLHNELSSALQSGRALQERYRVKLSDKDVTLRTIPKLGAVIHLKKKRGRSSSWKETLSQQHGYKLTENGSKIIIITPEWTTLHASIEELKTEIRIAENEITQKLCKQIISTHATLKATFSCLSELDVFQSFASYANQYECVRPLIHTDKSTVLIDARHPIAERALLKTNERFQPNSVTMKDEDGLCQIITGPNNGGKSTYLRQVAIAHVLAQAGSLVPAKRAELGIVTRIFTRFGSFDNMVLGKGTFLVEMEEMAKILHRADESSLVVMDEVGRGTGNEDGLSIAFGIVKYLVNKIGCRTLFATHLHSLVPFLSEGQDSLKVGKIGFFCIRSLSNSEELDGKSIIYFPHQVVRGVNPDSRGIDVARIAGLPDEVIQSAKLIKNKL